MSSSRERLISPFALTLVSAGFAVAFIALSPVLDDRSTPPESLDDLSLAYLKARAGSRKLGDEEAWSAVITLARQGRDDQAQALLDATDELTLDATRRTLLDIELAAGELQRAEAGLVDTTDGRGLAAVKTARRQLEQRLSALHRGERLPDMAVLERGAELSLVANNPALSATLYRQLAKRQPQRAAHWFSQCAQALSTSMAHTDAALDCYRQGYAASTERSARFALGLDWLALAGSRDAVADPSLPAIEQALAGDADASVAEREALARVYLEMERPGKAAEVYAALARVDTERRVRWFLAAGRWAEAANRPAEAAVYLDRISREVPAAEQAAHLGRIESLLLGAGDADAALASLRARIDAHEDDAELLRHGVSLARQTGKLDQALDWNTRLLALEPEAPSALAEQVELALALGNLSVALDAAERALAVNPSDETMRERLARVAEWGGKPARALAEWRALSRTRDKTRDLVEVARLAELLRHADLAAEARRELARRSPPDTAAIKQLVALYELDGRPDRAADALAEVMQLHGRDPDILVELAALHWRHRNYPDALEAWEQLATNFGRSSEETLARMELHWRLSEPDEALRVARYLESEGVTGKPTNYQVSLLAEVAWRYRRPKLLAIARPMLAEIEKMDQRVLQATRAVDELQQAGDEVAAREVATRLWRESGDADLALSALRLAVVQGNEPAGRELLDETRDSAALRGTPEYWSLKAALDLQQGDADAAERSYEAALGIEPGNAEAIGGLLWLLIGADRQTQVERMLERHRQQAVKEPSLWSAFAVAHLQTGDAAGSLEWFERAVPEAPRDYGFLLTYADALEAAGQVDRALQLRRYAIGSLRPHLLDGTDRDRGKMLRQYGRVLARYGSADDNEAWMSYVLNMDLDKADDSGFWREDMAISWLMATDRHEHARLIMTRLHEQRLSQPTWQDMALALHADDRTRIEAMLAAGTGLSDGNRMLALRRLGRDADAFALAVRTLEQPRSEDDRRIALEQYTALRRFRPADVSVRTVSSRSGDLATREDGLAIRYSFGLRGGDARGAGLGAGRGAGGGAGLAAGFGIGVDVKRRLLSSTRLVLDDRDEERELSLSLFRLSVRQSLRLSASFLTVGDEGRVWGDFRYARRDARARHELSIELAVGETPDESAELRLAGQRNRVGIGLDTTLGAISFARVSLEGSEISARGTSDRVSQGLRSRAEIGLRDSAGDISWSSSISVENVVNDRVTNLPEAFRASPTTTLDDVILEQASAVSLNGSLSRGSVGSAFPDAVSPRYFLNVGLGHYWPERAFALQLDAGAGFRVLGQDELGVSLKRGSRLGSGRRGADSTSFGVDYRYRF